MSELRRNTIIGLVSLRARPRGLERNKLQLGRGLAADRLAPPAGLGHQRRQLLLVAQQSLGDNIHTRHDINLPHLQLR